MSKTDLRNIEHVPERCGGRAVVAGTRIRVSVILTCHRWGMTVEEIVAQYPHLRPADVHDALAYAFDIRPRSRLIWQRTMKPQAQRNWPGGRGPA